MEITKQNVISDLGLQAADAATQEQTANSVLSALYTRVSMAIEDKLTEEDMKQVLELKDAESRLLLTAKKVGGFEDIIKNEYKLLIDEIKTQIQNTLP